MSVKWHHVTDVRGFLSQQGKRTSAAHSFTKRVLSWPYCSRCGLVALKNDATRREMGKPCVVEE